MYGSIHRDAAVYFCRRILPRVRRVVPGAEALVIGPGQPRFLRSLARTPGVAVTGHVSNFQSPLAEAVAAICPLRADAGFPVQAVEAMACGKPVIASPVVVDGLGLRPNDPILVAHSATEFANHAAALLEHTHMAESIGARGRQLVLERFDIRTVAERLDDILAHLVPLRRARLTAGR
jgi:glycosyltransferase involved in cell wall biosynthesis